MSKIIAIVSARLRALLVFAITLSTWIAAPQNIAAQAEVDPATISIGHVVDVDYVHYRVTGETSGEILASMTSNGPTEGERRYFGLTTSEVAFKYQLNQVKGSCNLINIGVKTRIIVTLPEHREVRRMDDELERQWLAFEKSLLEHERGHVSASKETSRRIYNELSNLRQESCVGMENRLNGVVDRLMAESEAYQDKYDRDTDHGATQGAQWPRY